ncbi:MAG: hypothetical protein ACHQNE_06490, partial [Candidatus Kapaibacterium sp.]
TPQFQKDEGKTLEVKAYFKSPMMSNYVPVDDQSFKIGPTPFIAVVMNSPMNAGDALQLKAAWDTLSGPRYVEVGSDHLTVESGGYFETTAKKEPGKDGIFFFDARPTSKAQSVTKKEGMDIPVTITDPVTGQSTTTTLHIDPKPQQQRPGYGGYRPGGGGGGGGGIH